ncbi:GlcNAc-PI de-N-acetylase [Sinosporangium siamense]|uniref:GlcNAc-PI de-N-acetylase n=3 Tax=Sinosporangium siamense TaxID=1367973 RepID=A0A919RJP5_9ACTN|nr:GlcNAc-PI de-N-acetylase [Sinosporangium siamense]
MVMMQDKVLMAVHAHPGPESTNTGGILARYAAQGVRTVLVTSTNGEFGNAQDGSRPGEPGHDPAAVARTRAAELRAAAGHLGIGHLEPLGYHDSGMADWDLEPQPNWFAQVSLDIVAARIADLIDRHRPQVVVTYALDAPYRHPDQVHTARAAHRAVEVSGVPVRLYTVAMGTGYWRGLRDAVMAAGLPEPFPDPEGDSALAGVEQRVTTSIDVSAVLERKKAAVLAHTSQVGGTWIEKLYENDVPLALGREDYIKVPRPGGPHGLENDFFAGL